MHFDVFAFWGIIILAMFAFAELRKEWRIVGLISSVFLIILGVWVIPDGLQIKTGETTVLNTISNSTVANITTTDTAQTVVGIWTNMTVPYQNIIGMPAEQIIAILFVGLGMWGAIVYWLRA